MGGGGASDGSGASRVVIVMTLMSLLLLISSGSCSVVGKTKFVIDTFSYGVMVLILIDSLKVGSSSVQCTMYNVLHTLYRCVHCSTVNELCS